MPVPPWFMCGLCSCTLTPALSFHLSCCSGPVASVPRGRQAVPSASHHPFATPPDCPPCRLSSCCQWLAGAAHRLQLHRRCRKRVSVVQYCRHCRRMGGGWHGGSAAAPARAVVGPNNERAQWGGVVLVNGSKGTIAVSGEGGSGQWASVPPPRWPAAASADRWPRVSESGRRSAAMGGPNAAAHVWVRNALPMDGEVERTPGLPAPQGHCFTGCICNVVPSSKSRPGGRGTGHKVTPLRSPAGWTIWLP